MAKGEAQGENIAELLEREKARTAALVSILDQTISALAQVSGQIASLVAAVKARQ